MVLYVWWVILDIMPDYRSAGRGLLVRLAESFYYFSVGFNTDSLPSMVCV